MMLFNRTWLKIAMYKVPDRMQKLGEKLALPGSNKQKERARSFEKACQEQDERQLNSLLTQAISDYLDSEEIPAALSNYCAKFGITVDMTGKSDLDRIREIDSYKEVIRARLEQEGL